MPTTSNRGYATDAHGGGVNTWDTPLNDVFNQIDQNFGAVSNVALSNIDVTLSAPQYVCGTIRFSGVLTGNVVITFPAVSGWWVVENACTGSFYVQMKCGAANRICAPPGESIDILTDGTGMRYRNLGHVGSYLDLGATAVPSWIANCTVPPYLLCDGTTFSGGTYPALAAILGGTTLPDGRGRGRIALNGGTGRVTTAGSGVNGDALLASGGAQTVTLAENQMPTHTHTVIDNGHDHGIKYSVGGSGGTVSPPAVTGINDGLPVPGSSDTSVTGITLGNAGSSVAHNNMQPAYVGGITLIRAA